MEPLPTFVSDGRPGGGERAVGGELHKEVSPRAQDALVGEVLHLVGVVHRRGVDVVPVLYQQPETIATQPPETIATQPN